MTLFLGRSGSTYLMEALAAHPAIEAGFEELGSRREEGAAAQLRFAREFFGREVAAPVAALGFKTKLQDVLDPEAFASLLRDVRANVVLLQRRNVVKAVVSWFRSEQVHASTGDWNVYSEAHRPPRMTIEPEEFVTRLRLYEEAREKLQEFALSLERPTLMLYYEDLIGDEAGTLNAVCGFLGVPPHPLRGKALKATPDDLRDAVTNVEELRHAAGGRYLAMFDEVPASGGVASLPVTRPEAPG